MTAVLVFLAGVAVGVVTWPLVVLARMWVSWWRWGR